MAVNDEVSVLIRQNDDGNGGWHVEVIEGRFSPDIELIPGDRIFVANVNGGDSTEETHIFSNWQAAWERLEF